MPSPTEPLAELKRILIAEDDEFLSSLLKNRLQRENFSVLVAKNGLEAFDALKTFKPHLVLLDIILPGKLGFEILEDAKKDPKLATIPFIVMSNLGQEEDIQKAKALGAIEYFVKARILIDDLVKKAMSVMQ
jgi:DNA-binding response OmpR family regulator